MPAIAPAVKSQYEIERDERIKRNEAFLVSLGLGKDGAAKLKAPKKASAPRTPRAKKVRGPRRTSSRLSGGAAPVERLSYDASHFDETPRPKKRARRGPKAVDYMTDAERAMLGEFDMDAFEEFLTDEHPISEDNRRQVMRQAEKLVSGQGVRYDSPTYGWDEGVVFRKGEPVTMSSDIIQVIADARDFEDEHGRDHGNGWLLNHPLRKLLIFQTHVARGEAAEAA